MGNIRDNYKKGGVVLSEEQKKLLEQIAQHNPQERQIQADKTVRKETNNKTSKEEESENQKKIEEIKKYKNPQQKIIDEMIAKQLENKER